jgi:hypothetical protein
MAQDGLTLAYDSNNGRGNAANDQTTDSQSKKTKMEIQVCFMNGTAMRGFVYVTDGERVADLLNDGRQFIPFLDAGNSVRLINKMNILDVKPANQDTGDPNRKLSVV